MIMKCKAHCSEERAGRMLRHGTVALAVVSLLAGAGCSKTKKIEFCEGVSPKGEGVNCGIKFETGDLTAVIRSEEPFQAESLAVRIYDAKKLRPELVETVTVPVKQDQERASATLTFLAGGKYLVKAELKGKVIAQSPIEIVE